MRFRLTFHIEVEAESRVEAVEIGHAIMDGGLGSEGVPGSPKFEMLTTRVRRKAREER